MNTTYHSLFVFQRRKEKKEIIVKEKLGNVLLLNSAQHAVYKNVQISHNIHCVLFKLPVQVLGSSIIIGPFKLVFVYL